MTNLTIVVDDIIITGAVSTRVIISELLSASIAFSIMIPIEHKEVLNILIQRIYAQVWCLHRSNITCYMYYPKRQCIYVERL